MKYILVTWSDNSQDLMEQDWFNECELVNSEYGINEYGSSSYLVPEHRYDEWILLNTK